MVKSDFDIALLWSRALLWLLLGSVGTQLSGQRLIYDHYGIREGLSNRLIRDIEIDDFGLVWVATPNGLNRFDGYDFVTFSTTQSFFAAERLSQAYVQEIEMTQDGKLFLFYQDLYSSFDVFDPITFEVERVEVSLQVAGQPRGFYVSENNEVYAISKEETFTAISVFDYARRDFEEVCRIDEAWERQYPTINFLVDRQGRVILYDQEHGLRICSQSNTEKYPLQDLLGDITETPAHLNILYQDLQERIWLSFAGQAGVYRMEEQSDSLFLYQGLGKEANYAYVWEDDNANLIFSEAATIGNFAESEHLWCLTADQRLLNFDQLLEVGHYIVDIRSQDFFRTLFIGTDTGLKVAQNTTTRIDQYLATGLGEGRRGASMRGITSDGNGKVYFGREVNNWYVLDTETKLLDTIRLHDRYGNYLRFNDSQGVWYDAAGYLWGVTGDGTDRRIGYLHQYDVENCTTNTYVYPHALTCYAVLDDSTYCFGTRSEDNTYGLVYFDRRSHSFFRYSDVQGDNPFAKAHIRYIEPEGEFLWIGTEQGLFHLDTNTGLYEWYVRNRSSLADDEDAISVDLADNTVYSIYIDEEGVLWLGTLNGLTMFDRRNDRWKSYTTKDGLVSNTIASILPSAQGGLWVSTYNGLSYFIPGEDEFKSFFQIDGLAHNEFNRFSAHIDENGRYYLGGVNGISSFVESDLLVIKDIPKVLLTRFSHYNERIDSTIIAAASLLDNPGNPSIVIEPYYSYFSFDFTLPIYKPTTNNRFRYRIGKDPTQEWIYLKEDRSLYYNDIKSGKYTIYVQGADPNGNWGKESLEINMIVKDVFYKRPWFLAILLLLGAAMIYGILRYRLEEKLRMERLRTQLASDLHDEVSGLLAGISLQSELLRSQVQDRVIDQKLQHIRQASQRAMSKMSDVIWSIDSRRDRLSELINRMEEHADEVLLPLEVRYDLKTFHLDTDGPIPATIRQNIYFIYKEAINNVAKHAKASKVDIWMGNNGPQFELRIQDDGDGNEEQLAEGKRRRGQGLANLRMRAQRLGAEIDILNGQGFTIHLRMKRFI
ncbi:MAG: two-component regulator propeller domain-containing protein [Bacteroidota bacterium]